MNLQKHLGAIALAGLMAGAAPFAGVVQAQQSVPSAEEVTGAEVDAFVGAYEEILAIEEEYSAQMAETTDEAELRGLLEEAQIRKTEAVEATSGIDVDRYVEILTIAQADPDLSAQILQKLEQ